MDSITVRVVITAPIEKVWTFYTEPSHIIQWNSPSEDWYTPRATNDVRVGGMFLSRMEARDGSEGFDFKGTYTAVQKPTLLAYTMEDGRTARIELKEDNGKTHVMVTFDPETINPVDFQRAGWQAILDSFKKYVERS